jgi:hypothetical protein
MTEYKPNKFVVLRISESPKLYKVFGSWSGGYLDGDYWRLNSGIKSVSQDGQNLIFHGLSGSRYIVYRESYGVTGAANMAQLDYFMKKNEELYIMAENTDWVNFSW